MAINDPHGVCIACLPSSHKVESCYHCKGFSSRTLRDRERIRLQAVAERLKVRMVTYQEGQYLHSDSHSSKKKQVPDCSPSLSPSTSRKRPSTSPAAAPTSKKRRSEPSTSRRQESPSSRQASASRKTSGSRYSGERSLSTSRHHSTSRHTPTSKSTPMTQASASIRPPSPRRRSTSRSVPAKGHHHARSTSRHSPRRRERSTSRAARGSPASRSTSRRSFASKSPSRRSTSTVQEALTQRRSRSSDVGSTSRHSPSRKSVSDVQIPGTPAVSSASPGSSPGLNTVQISPESSPVGAEKTRRAPRALSSQGSDYSQTYSPSRTATTPQGSPSAVPKRISRSPTRSPRRDRSRGRSRSYHSSPKRRRHDSPTATSPTRSSLRDYSPTLSATPPSRVSPIDDLGTFSEVLCRGANKLNISMTIPVTSSSVIFETLHHRASVKPLLPLVPGILDLVNHTFLTPASAGSVPSRIAKK